VEPLNQTKNASGETEVELIDLLSAATPTALPESQKRASLQAILAPKPERVARGFRLARPAFAFGFLLLLAGVSTAATVGARWMKRRAAEPIAPTPPPVAPAPPVHARPAAMAAPTEELAPAPEPPAVEIRKLAAPAASRTHAARGENPSALMEAVKALRQDQDPARASRLLRDYLRLYPRGSLSEEARALSIEAARAQGSPNTVELADEYLRLYPHGRFRKAAAQAAGRTDP
jgi:hypothetical protein